MSCQDSVERVLCLMKDTFGDEFKTYYDGDPEVIPRFNLPCLIVMQTTDNTSESETGSDDVDDEIRIKLVFDKREDFDFDMTKDVDMTEKRLRKLVAGRGTDGRYLSTSVKGALREDLLDGPTAIAPTMTIQYGINPRETLGSEGNVPLTAEAWVTFTLRYAVDTYL